jgi:membrane protein
VTVAGLNPVRTGKDIFKDIGKYDLSGFAAQLAYRFFLALIPALIFLAALGGFIADWTNTQNPTDKVMSTIGTSLPSDARSVFRDQVEGVVNNRSTGLLSFGAISALWTAAGGVGALTKGFNRVYEVEDTRPIYKRYPLMIGLTLLGAAFIITAFLGIVVGQAYGTAFAENLGLSSTLGWVILVARWPAALVLILIAVAFLYWAAPNAQLPFRWISPGSAFFAIGWVIGTYLFGLYVSHFGSYNETYGALGGVVVLLLWFYITGLLLLLGAELNAYLARQKIPAELEAQGANVPGWPEHDSVQRGRSQAPNTGRRGQAWDNRGKGEEARNGHEEGRREFAEPALAPVRARPAQSLLVGAITALALAGATRRLISKYANS